MIPVEYVTVNGKKFLYSVSRLEAQCAYCLYVQPLMPIRNEDGLTIGLDIKEQDEEHKKDCKQK